MPETAGPQPGEDDDLAELAALALVAFGTADSDRRDAALINAGDILLRRPDLETEWRGMRETTAHLELVLPDEAALPDPTTTPATADGLAPVVPFDAAPSARRRGPDLARFAAAAAVTAIVAGGLGYVVGDRRAPTTAAAPDVVVTAGPSTLDAPGTLVRSATATGTGASMGVRVIPAAGWVRLEATVTGVAAGRRCRLVAVPRSGSPVLAGSWLVSPKGEREGTGLHGTALIPASDLAAVRVEDETGAVLVDVRI